MNDDDMGVTIYTTDGVESYNSVPAISGISSISSGGCSTTYLGGSSSVRCLECAAQVEPSDMGTHQEWHRQQAAIAALVAKLAVADLAATLDD